MKLAAYIVLAVTVLVFGTLAFAQSSEALPKERTLQQIQQEYAQWQASYNRAYKIYATSMESAQQSMDSMDLAKQKMTDLAQEAAKIQAQQNAPETKPSEKPVVDPK